MAERAFDPYFPLISPKSAAPLSIERRLVVTELSRELPLRRDSYPRRIAAGKMSQAEADWQIGAMAAIHADLAADLQFTTNAGDAWRDARAKADARLVSFRWLDLVNVLRREILLRRKHYPLLEEERPAVQLRQQLERIEAAHFIYWVQARRFWPDELDHKRYRSAELTEAERQIFREAYQRHRDLFEPIEDAPRGAYRPSPENQMEAANG